MKAEVEGSRRGPSSSRGGGRLTIAVRVDNLRDSWDCRDCSGENQSYVCVLPGRQNRAMWSGLLIMETHQEKNT